ncbi:2-oxoglutarate (2OG) and Fe(II)-dependent oxygenase superfamily protein [Rhynchospora pubera]|uniref:2-oxoglutarate (2OG) and Fe(II)-dependent oxygenase superfamily protein n=1 Tax=Rhynchospora pubera TaxID=906938 RepID=A0AAV8H8Z9_9POAL|nr:2-oxoglutarate (2OG) and Fe(II)-dependent oxygenase superfamily protein [Rhynchospora pubera]
MATYDRTAELHALDATKTGVQGLVASGCTSLPRIFIVPPEDRIPLLPALPTSAFNSIPVVDISSPNKKQVVEEVLRASSEWGFLQVVGHGVPQAVMDSMLDAVRAFHEGKYEEKARLYSREPEKVVKYHCNFDLYQSKVTNWRDTLYCRMAPDPPTPEELPDSCRDTLLKYSTHVMELGNTMFGFLSEALGLDSSYLTDIECNQGQILVCHYYPPCPEPEVAIGTSQHSDSAFLTILLQDCIGGLQIHHDGEWIDVPHVPGAFIVNIGDLLQLVSNDKFKSVEHRVLAKNAGPRVSVACFFSTHFHPASTRLYGPIKELLSDRDPPLYRQTLVRDFIAYYYYRGLDGKSAIEHFRV